MHVYHLKRDIVEIVSQSKSKKYQELDYYETSPQLPYGYPTSILLALIPPLWFRIVNPLVP